MFNVYLTCDIYITFPVFSDRVTNLSLNNTRLSTLLESEMKFAGYHDTKEHQTPFPRGQ